MERLNFDMVFVRYPDGSVEPRRKVRVGAVTMQPGARFSPGVSFGGVDLAQFSGHDLDVETDGDTLVVTAVYTNPPFS